MTVQQEINELRRLIKKTAATLLAVNTIDIEVDELGRIEKAPFRPKTGTTRNIRDSGEAGDSVTLRD